MNIRLCGIIVFRQNAESWYFKKNDRRTRNQDLYLAKTLADCFKFRNKIGVDVARYALKTTLREQKADPNEI